MSVTGADVLLSVKNEVEETRVESAELSDTVVT
jgi:hypothetical protein